MRRSSGFVAVLVLGTVGGESTAVRADDPKKDPLPLAIDVRKSLKKVFHESDVKQAEKEAPTATDGELAEDLAWAEKCHGLVLQKFRKLQRKQVIVGGAAGNPFLRTAHFTLTAASLELERKERLEAIERREAEAIDRRFPDRSPEKPISPDAWHRWKDSPEAKQIEEDRKRVGGWFRQTFDEELRRARAGESEAGQTLAEVEKETFDEMRQISGLRRKLVNEQRRRRGEPPIPEAPEPEIEVPEGGFGPKGADRYRPQEASEKARFELRLAALRSEYEARPDEAVVAIFQVWKGAAPYVGAVVAPGSVPATAAVEAAEAGQVNVMLSYPKKGDYTATLTVTDAHGASKTASAHVVVKGEPMPPEKDDEPNSGGGGAGTGSANAPVPVVGTFDARLVGGNGSLPRFDQGNTPQVPLSLTIAPDGSMSASVRYTLPESEMKIPPPLNPGDSPMQKVHWKTSFDLEGKVDWATGHTVITIKNGHDERGYEKDVTGRDGQGKEVKLHWREWDKLDYHGQLEGWTVPGPQAAKWLGVLLENKMAVSMLGAMGSEKLGLPPLTVTKDGKASYAFRGFFGAGLLGGAGAPDGVVPRRMTCVKHVWHQGYDKENETDTDKTADDQKVYAANAKAARGMWTLRLVGLAPVESAPGASSAPAAPATPALPPSLPSPKKEALLAFGMWPVKGITAQPGKPFRPHAMGVYGQDVFKAVDLTEKAAWTVGRGLVPGPDGTYTASAPGTYELKATVQTPDGPMSSTIRVVIPEK